MARKKEIDEAERKKELLRKLRKGPDIDKYVDDKKRRYTSYAGGARIYSMSYYTFIKLARFLCCFFLFSLISMWLVHVVKIKGCLTQIQLQWRASSR